MKYAKQNRRKVKKRNSKYLKQKKAERIVVNLNRLGYNAFLDSSKAVTIKPVSFTDEVEHKFLRNWKEEMAQMCGVPASYFGHNKCSGL